MDVVRYHLLLVIFNASNWLSSNALPYVSGERLIQFASENLVTEILIHPAVSTLAQCVKNLLSSFTRHRHIIHSGYTFAGNGSWALQVRSHNELVPL